VLGFDGIVVDDEEGGVVLRRQFHTLATH
jgi:hypothetical protein